MRVPLPLRKNTPRPGKRLFGQPHAPFVNGPGYLSVHEQRIGRAAPAPVSLAPHLASRYGVTRLREAPSYFIRVWPGGRGHHVVRTGLLC
jgi:hypothetical protein